MKYTKVKKSSEKWDKEVGVNFINPVGKEAIQEACLSTCNDKEKDCTSTSLLFTIIGHFFFFFFSPQKGAKRQTDCISLRETFYTGTTLSLRHKRKVIQIVLNMKIELHGKSL